ncbi:MAG: hypothetical protein EON93_03030, partial [Burkholderiales bacterium]
MSQAPFQDADLARLERLEQSVLEQGARIDAQQKEIERQTDALADQRAELKRQIADIQVLRGKSGNAQIVVAAAPDQAFPAETSGQGSTIRLSDSGLLQLSEAPIEREAFSALRAGQSPAYRSSASGGAAAPVAVAAQPQQTVGAPPPEPREPAPQMAALPESLGV